MSEATSDWEIVIGLEVHAQLKTEAKLFSSASAQFGGEPNSHTTEVDLGMPGVLPVLNEKAVRLAVRAALGLGCRIQPLSVFARKHYFYPDLPKGYQISQYEQPYSLGGGVPIQIDGRQRTIALTRIHMEEDAAKNIHDDAVTGGGVTHVDLNRAGMPLIEIVSEPDMRTPEEAGAYLRSLRSILRYLDVSEADMEKGHFRCDANVSVRRKGEQKLGTKVELKNLNSFKFVEKAIAYEAERQIALIEDGKTVRQETRNWDDRAGESRPQRGKENADDYRYFPDPDLPPLKLDPAWLEEQRKTLPELPHQKRARYVAKLGLPEQDATVLTEDRAIAELFEQTAALHGDAKAVANWIMRSVLGLLSDMNATLEQLALTPRGLADLLKLVDAGKLTATSARELLAELARNGGDPAQIMKARGLEAVSDTGELEALARGVIEASPSQVEQYRSGQEKVFNFFLGKLMKATQGKADPKIVREVLERLLDA